MSIRTTPLMWHSITGTIISSMATYDYFLRETARSAKRVISTAKPSVYLLDRHMLVLTYPDEWRQDHAVFTVR